jgi:glyoxylase-like metal-dependent hydrolase (beta-lactamase superfamily II)
VIETPGHCPSHVCLVQRDQGILIAGDLLCPVFVPWMDYGYSPDPLAESLSSLDRLAAEPHLALALPGHGRPIEQVEAVVAMTRDGLRRRLKSTLDTVRCRPGGAYDITVRMFGDEPDMVAVTHMTEVLAYLRHLRLRGDVVRDSDSEGRLSYRATPSPRGGP